MPAVKFKRILLKLSGEYIAGKQGFGFCADVIDSLASQISEIHDLNVEIAIVIGGGNIFRGGNAKALKMERVTGDHIGMMATLMNGLCMQDALESKGKNTRLMSALTIPSVAEPYIKRRAIRHLEKKRIVILGAGTGNPYLTTDTAAALRAMEINADIMIKGTMVDGVYDKDPLLNKDAVKFNTLNYQDVLINQLAVMDSTAISFSRDNKLPLYVLNIGEQRALLKFLLGENNGTLVSDSPLEWLGINQNKNKTDA